MANRQRRTSAALPALLLVSFALVIGGGISYSINRFGDVQIMNDGVTFKCDRINCPAGSVSCRVTKAPDASNPQAIERRNICYAQNGTILLESTSTEQAQNGVQQYLNVLVTADGSSSSIMSSNSGGLQMSNNQNNVGNVDGEALSQSIMQGVQQEMQNLDQTLRESLGGLWPGFRG